MPLTGAATIDMNGHQVNIQSLVTTSGLTDLNFADPTTGIDLLTIGSGGLDRQPGHRHQLRHGPGMADIGNSYELITGTLGTFDADATGGEFHPSHGAVRRDLLAGPDGSGNIDLIVAAVPEPGTLALLGAGLMSLLGFAWRRRKAG